MSVLEPDLKRNEDEFRATGTTYHEAEGLYVHVPYCVRKCPYCDFYSVATGPTPPDATRFLAALERELARLPSNFAPRTVFFGGGTPTELASADLERLLTLVRERIRLERLEEWTCEANPGTLDREKAQLLLCAGVNRFSIGVQSFDDEALRFLGRIHNGREASAALELVRELGCSNLNIDIISALPRTPRDRLERDLKRALRFEPEHISCYTLTFEEGTPLEALRRLGRVRRLDEEAELAEFLTARRLLRAAGYEHYEISNFCRKADANPLRPDARDLRCRHNLLYWGAGQYFGVGPGAHSHVARKRYANRRDVAAWIEAQLGKGGEAPQPERALAFEETLSPRAWAREVFVMGLRRLDGVDKRAFARATGFVPRALYDERAPGIDHPIERVVERGLLEDDGARIRLTESGLPLADLVFVELI